MDDVYVNIFIQNPKFLTFTYIIINPLRTGLIWICYVAFFCILIVLNHSVKNWILAMILSIILYIHLNVPNKQPYLGIQRIKKPWVILCLCSGVIFITTWLFQFLKFEEVYRGFLHIKDMERFMKFMSFWGFKVFSDEEIASKIILYSTFLILSVIVRRNFYRNQKH